MIALPPRKKPFHHTLPHTKHKIHTQITITLPSIPHRQSRINTAARRTKTTLRMRTHPDESQFDATPRPDTDKGPAKGPHSTSLPAQLGANAIHPISRHPAPPQQHQRQRHQHSRAPCSNPRTQLRHSHSAALRPPKTNRTRTATTMHHSSPLALLLALLFSILLPPTPVSSQAAVVGGPAPPAPTQYPVVVMGPKIQVVAGVTQTVQAPYTQTFAEGAVETWAWGAVRKGSVGMGGIGGEVGVVKED